jgi:hypothetical protein
MGRFQPEPLGHGSEPTTIGAARATLAAMPTNVLSRLAGSTKFVVMVVAIVAVAALAYAGRYPADQAVEFVKWLTGAFVVAQGVQAGAEAVGAGISTIPSPQRLPDRLPLPPPAPPPVNPSS